MDSPVPEPVARLLLAALPAIAASVFAAASAALAALPGARKAALADALGGSARAALERYVAEGNAIETRWTLLRVFCIASSALLLRDALDGLVAGTLALLVAATLALVTYGAASQIGTALAERNPETSATLLLRWLRPLDLEPVFESFKKTNRCVVVEESLPMFNVGAEVAAQIQNEMFDYMDAPVKRVAAMDIPLPYSREIEQRALPSPEKIIQAVKEVI